MIADNYTPVKTLGNGVTTEFSFGFALIAEENIRVYLEDVETGAQTLQTLGTDYTVEFDDDTPGGIVTFTSAPSDDYYVVIGRDITKSQEVPLTTSSGFQAKVVESMVDKVVGNTQDIKEEVQRTLKTKLGGTTDITVEEPDPGKALKWNPAGDGLENSDEDLDDIVDAAQAAQAAAEVAQSAAEAAQSAAQTAKTNAETAETNAETAETNAETAETNAETAETNAVTAKNSAQAAQSAAETAQGLAETAQGLAETAKTGAEAAQTAAEAAQTAAETAQGLAETAQGAAETAQTGAETAETNAETAQTAAEAARDQAQGYAAALKGTSTSSIAIGTGSKTFTTQAGKQFAAGQFVLVLSDADPTNYMHGQVTSYSGTTLVVNVTNVGGSGTHTDWSISVSGSRGATGATGATGTIPIAAAAGTVDAITSDYTPDVSLADLTLVAFVATGANTSTTPTFAPDGLTAHTITKRGGAALVAGDIPGAGAVCIVEYNLANTRWELLNPGNPMYLDTDGTLAANSDTRVPSQKAVKTYAAAKGANTDITSLLGLTGDVANVAWTNYGNNSTIVGWSNFTTKQLYYKKIGNLMCIHFHIEGPSNSTAVSFTLPNSLVGLSSVYFFFVAQDADAWVSAACCGYGYENSNIFILHKGVPTGAWTASGTKIVTGMLFYEATN